MERSMRIVSAAAMAALALLVVGRTTAHAVIQDNDARKCLEAVAKASGQFVQQKLKTIQKCKEKSVNAKTGDECAAGEPANTINTKLVPKLESGIQSKCGVLNTFQLAALGYPGMCLDTNLGDGFTVQDLKDCMHNVHEAAVDMLIDLEYGSMTGPLANDALKCQKEIAKDAAKFTTTRLKAIQKCRNAINKGSLTGIQPENCAIANSKTSTPIMKAADHTRAMILKKCTDAIVATLDVCDPPATTRMQAGDCIVQTHAVDLIDYEYARQPICGDGIRNTADEECDGADDSACPGNCGTAPDFPCLCLNVQRERVIEHANGDLDNGWTGMSHDSGLVEGGGYVVDLYDCDGPGGPDTVCTVGPSCSLPPNSACSNDAECSALAQGACRKRRTAVDPHCNLDIQQTCTTDANCPGTGNFCVKQFHGAPLPLSSGGISVCVLNVFSEDIVGTTELSTGSSSIRLREKSITHLGPTSPQPCPVCGGFCGDPPGGSRATCSSNADCTGVPCILDSICSFGPNVDRPCRADPPFGGSTTFFGNPSVDCPPFPGANISGGGLDILFNPAMTGTVTKLPSFPCNSVGFTNKTCVGGPNQGRPCTSVLDCAPGTCNDQCFCASGGGTAQKPNDCDDACVGGGSDAAPCGADSDCSGGFCHRADCRDNPADPDGANEGQCTVGPTIGTCSITKFKTCNVDGDCRGTSCSFCQPGETCQFGLRECFVNSGIIRTGVANATDPTGVAIYCIAATSSSAINSVAGLPGPGALRSPETRVLTGF